MNIRNVRHLSILALTWAAWLAIAPHSAFAASVTLAWDPPIPSDNVAGYRIYYGTASRIYSAPIDVGNATESVVANLDSTVTYFFAITTYNTSGNESDFSAELVWDNTAPAISGPVNVSLTADQSGQASLPSLTGQVVVTDNISSVGDITISQAPAAGTMVGVGTTTVTLTATDEAGNSSDWTVNVTVTPLPMPVPMPPQRLRIVS